MEFYRLLLGVLGTWRITHLLSEEDGPWEVFAHLRRAAGNGVLAGLFGCFLCLSLWVAIPFCLLLAADKKEALLLWPALSGAAILIERMTSKQEQAPPAIYFETKDTDDGLLRKEHNNGGIGD